MYYSLTGLFIEQCVLSELSMLDEKIESLIRDLPDPGAARLWLDRLSREHPREAERLSRNVGLLSDALALSAWSPLLATTLAEHPDYLKWLARERLDTRVRTREELGESLARFGLTHSQLDPQVLLARFRRRELLRIYLHDIRGTSALVEITEELSNLADAVLEHALSLARQELNNRYGPPTKLDDKGRITNASLCIVALGKLGSGELNYASDIDLLFLYSDDGQTSERERTVTHQIGSTSSNLLEQLLEWLANRPVKERLIESTFACVRMVETALWRRRLMRSLSIIEMKHKPGSDRR